tara:strand:+ start:836 stop:1219 length:384 start_codon:yes stop_codon:yes gene_type:complete
METSQLVIVKYHVIGRRLAFHEVCLDEDYSPFQINAEWRLKLKKELLFYESRPHFIPTKTTSTPCLASHNPKIGAESMNLCVTTSEPYEMPFSQNSRQFEEAGQGDQPFCTDEMVPSRIVCCASRLW